MNPDNDRHSSGTVEPGSLFPPIDPGRHFVFVYGTLMHGCENHSFLAGQCFVGEARTRVGYRLHQLTGYPGMVPCASAAEGVPGEVWSVTGDCLERLHRLEGVQEGLYAYEPVDLQPPYDRFPTFTYYYLHDVTGRPVVEGRWKA